MEVEEGGESEVSLAETGLILSYLESFLEHGTYFSSPWYIKGESRLD